MSHFAKAGRVVAVLFAAALAIAGQARANVILSEDFAGGVPAGWTISPGSSAFDTGVAGYGEAIATDLGNSFQSSIDTPTLSVVSGAAYQVSLDVASFGGCSFSGDCSGQHRFAIYQNGICITGCTNNVAPSSIATNRPLTAADFAHSTWDFVAVSNSIVLTFQDRTEYPSNLGAAGVMDNFVVTGPAPASTGVPEPAAWSLMIAGFGLAGAALRRRRRLSPA